MGRTLESKQQIVEELSELLDNAELALVLDYQGLSIKEMTDLRGRLRAAVPALNVGRVLAPRRR